MIREKTLHKLNELPTEVKIQVAQALSLMNATENRMHAVWGDYDLSAQLALKDSLGELERLLKKMAKGNVTQKQLEELDFDTAKLKTLSENILHWTVE